MMLSTIISESGIEVKAKIESAKNFNKSNKTVIFIHGRSGHINSMAIFKHVIFDESTNYVFLEAPYQFSFGGFTWWPSDSSENINQSVLSAAKLIKETIIAILTINDFTQKRLVAIGFSQGAVILSSLMQTAQSFFLGNALLSGFGVLNEGGVSILPTKHVFLYVGLNDKLVPYSRATSSYLELFGESFRDGCYYVEEEVGHKVGIRGMRELRGWLNVLEH